MKTKILIIMLLCAVLVAFPKLSYTAEKATEEDAVQMVEMAGKLIEAMGDAALAVISDPSGRCCDRERNLYVFVYSDDVVLLADSMRHDVIGVSFKGKDPVVNHYQVSEIMVQKAMKEGSGWTDYPYMNAATGRSARNIPMRSCSGTPARTTSSAAASGMTSPRTLCHTQCHTQSQ